MPTFGDTSAATANDNEIFANNKFGSIFTLTDDYALVSKITARLSGLGSGVGDQQVRAAIYAASGGVLGALIAQSRSVLIADGQAVGPVDFNFAVPPLLRTGDYGLVLMGSTASQTTIFYYTFETSRGRHRNDTYSDGFSDPFGAAVTDNARYAIYATYAVSAPSIAITSPANGATISGLPLVTMAVGGAPHHVQLEISADGTTWQRLCAKNCIAPWEHNFNTKRFPNGNYRLRARYYTGADESTLLLTSPEVAVTIANTVGTVRDLVGGVDLLSTANSVSSDGDVWRLSGTFPKEGADQATVSITKKVSIIKHPSASVDPQVKTRIRWKADGIYIEDVDVEVSPVGGTITTLMNIEAKGVAFKRCGFSNLGSSKNVGASDGIEYIFGNEAVDTIVDEPRMHDNGDWADAIYSLFHIHGLYAQNTRRLYVRQPQAWHNASRQIQLGPNCREATIEKPVGYRSRHGLNFYCDTGMGNDTTLASTLNAGDTTATLTDGSTWGTAGYLFCGGEYIEFTNRVGNVLTLAEAHAAHASGSTAKYYTVSSYNTVEGGILGYTGNDGAGGRSSSEGIIFGVAHPGNASAATPKGIRNEVLNMYLHEPAPLGTAPDPPDSNAYLDLRVLADFEGGGFTDAGGNILTTTPPGYLDPDSGNFQLAHGAPATGYGPDSIQPFPVDTLSADPASARSLSATQAGVNSLSASQASVRTIGAT